MRFAAAVLRLTGLLALVLGGVLLSSPAGSAEEPKPRAVFKIDEDIGSFALSPDGKHLAVVTKMAVQVWDVSGGKKVATLTREGGVKNQSEAIASVAFSGDGRRLAAGSGTWVQVWEVASGQSLALLTEKKTVTSMAFHPEGKQLASAGDLKNVLVWEIATGRVAARLEHGSQVGAVAYSPDGKRLASGGSDGIVKLWDAAGGKELMVIKGPVGWVHFLAFTTDGKVLASEGKDATIRLWDTEKGTLKGQVRPKQEVRSRVFRPDGKQLITADQERLMMWQVPGGKEVARSPALSILARRPAFDREGHTLITERPSVRTEGTEQIAEGGFVELWDIAALLGK